MTEQLRPDGSLRHLLTLETLTRSQIERLLERSQSFVRPLGEAAPRSTVLSGLTVANLFTEPSTRTRVSFELAAMARGEGPSDAFIALGYAGWESGQLEREMKENAWASMPVDARVVFELPFEERWAGAWRLMGVDVDRLSTEAGHA